ncbi:MAG: hypothetical protein IJ424_05670 [Oscillospiraceae bacterium]|nr:hypothetical protein [Oscillospiraceae bacterium]
MGGASGGLCSFGGAAVARRLPTGGRQSAGAVAAKMAKMHKLNNQAANKTLFLGKALIFAEFVDISILLWYKIIITDRGAVLH